MAGMEKMEGKKARTLHSIDKISCRVLRSCVIILITDMGVAYIKALI